MAKYQREKDATFPASKYHSSRRTSSFSSSSSSSSLGSMSYFPDGSPPSTLATPLRLSGIPFSWEYLPGVPKNKLHSQKNKELSRNLLPPPPTAATMTPSSKTRHPDEAVLRKKHHLSRASESLPRDPFFAAFVECCKDGGGGGDRRESDGEYWMGPKVGRSISDRFGHVNNLYASCKNTCAISDSIVCLPRPRRGWRYGLISNRPR